MEQHTVPVYVLENLTPHCVRYLVSLHNINEQGIKPTGRYTCKWHAINIRKLYQWNHHYVHSDIEAFSIETSCAVYDC